MITTDTPLRFDRPVRPGGYAWWYLDAVSDDGAIGLTIIVFVGSVFSTRYARARRAGAGDPERHCAVNVAIYPRGGARRIWTMAEHGDFVRDREHLRVGASAIRWRDDALEVELDERRTRFFGRAGAPIRGRVRLHPSARFGPRIELDRWRSEGARHRWYPVAPHARVEVELDEPGLRFSGSGYHDVNEGDEGLEQGFDSWTWSRSELGDEAVILYDVVDPAGEVHPRGWRFAANTQTTDVIEADALGPALALPSTRWGVGRSLRSDPGATPILQRTLEDTPFYSRSLIETQLLGRACTTVHESLSLRRFAARWVQLLLPFKTAAS
ncbi:MAG: carotenoid 1,2-hydratase [Myxococcales bacterium]|nr:carotenoid 1,2-hydratase [Myxococcales bacterium]